MILSYHCYVVMLSCSSDALLSSASCDCVLLLSVCCCVSVVVAGAPAPDTTLLTLTPLRPLANVSAKTPEQVSLNAMQYTL